MSVSNQNVVPAFDPTGYASISGVQLKQLIDGITMFADKGLVIETTDTVLGVPDVPDAVTHPEWQRCMWRRITPSSVVPYLWVQSSVNHSEGGNDIKKWYSINQLAGLTSNITTNQIADGAVTDPKLAPNSVDVTKIFGNISLNATLSAGVIMDTTPAGGDLEGTYPNPTIKEGAVNAASLDDHSIADIKMEFGDTTHGLQLDKLKSVGVTGDMIRTGVGPAFLWEKWTPNKIVGLADPLVAADVGKIVRVKNPYTTGFELGSSIVKQYDEFATATATTTKTTASDGVTPVIGAAMDLLGIIGTAGVITFTPALPLSTIVVEIDIPFSSSSDVAAVTALFIDDIFTAGAVVNTFILGTCYGKLKAIINNVTGTAFTVKAGIARSTATNARTIYVNTTSGGAHTGVSSLIGVCVKITEYH